MKPNKKDFGPELDIRYDCIVNHDVYSFLQVTVEIDRNQDNTAYVLVNGREIGKLLCHRNNSGRVTHYTAIRFVMLGDRTKIKMIPGEYAEMGKAAATMICGTFV